MRGEGRKEKTQIEVIQTREEVGREENCQENIQGGKKRWKGLGSARK